jgi:hypothetical protein
MNLQVVVAAKCNNKFHNSGVKALRHPICCVTLYVPLLKAGVAVTIDREEKWSISPHTVIPLNHAVRIQETKMPVGLTLERPHRIA